jgi:hypothetical protein
MLATCNVYRAHRHGSESPYPGSTPGLNPCNHLAWRACGLWRTHKHNTYNHFAWLASEERNHLRQTWNDMIWHGMTWVAGAAPKGPDLGEARAEATHGVGVWPGAQSRFLGRGEVVIELGAPRRWRRWRRSFTTHQHAQTKLKPSGCSHMNSHQQVPIQLTLSQHVSQPFIHDNQQYSRQSRGSSWGPPAESIGTKFTRQRGKHLVR